MQLAEYDEANGTELNHTLRTFMRMQYNAAATAKALFVARSSFLKRMARIEELTGIDLENYEERMYLALSYEIYESLGEVFAAAAHDASANSEDANAV